MTERRERDVLSLRGMSHLLRGMEVGGEIWVGMLDIESPTASALLTPSDARELIRWLTRRLEAHHPFKCKCGHGLALHGLDVDDDDPEEQESAECVFAGCACERMVG